jgi:anti-sigma-K factor RskA
MAARDSELLIDDYLEGRLRGSEREAFEASMKADPELRGQVHATTTSIHLVRKTLGQVEPAAGFEDRVSSKIQDLSESNAELRARLARTSAGPLTADDPDARLLSDPQAARERRRLILIAVAVAALFATAVIVLLFVNR